MLKYKINILAIWYVYKELILAFSKILGKGIKKIKIVSGFELELETVSKNVYPLIFFLTKHSLCQFKFLADIICYDEPKNKNRFVIIYNLISIRYGIRFRVFTRNQEIGQLLSITSVRGIVVYRICI